MRLTHSILAGALFALACCAVPAQTAVMQRSGNSGAPFAFNYDAAHDQISASGIGLRPQVTPPAAPTPTTGTVVVTLNISLVSKYAKANHVNCSLMLIGGDIDLGSGTVDGGIETAGAQAKSNGHDSAVCTLTIPYSWSLSSSPASTTGLILVFGAADHCDDGGMVLRSTLQLDGPEALPKNGTMAQYSFDVAL